jgi:sterol O-acyltransferase
LIFKPQYSTLDRSNPVSAASPFIGFYTLFWLGLSLFTIRTFLVSYRATGQFFGHRILSILRKDLFVLGITDAVMFASTFICVLLQQAVYRRWISWNGWGWKLQHVGSIKVLLIVDMASLLPWWNNWLGFLQRMGMASNCFHCVTLFSAIDETTFICILQWMVI